MTLMAVGIGVPASIDFTTGPGRIATQPLLVQWIPPNGIPPSLGVLWWLNASWLVVLLASGRAERY